MLNSEEQYALNVRISHERNQEIGKRVSDTLEHKVVYTRNRFPKQIAKGLCKGCHEPITAKRRTSWCSDECKKRYDPYWVKRAVIARDKHVCQICGLDIRAAVLAWRRARPNLSYLHESWRDWVRARPHEEYDHIVPFCEGGKTVLENMRTLCHACHLKRTAEWRKAKFNDRSHEGSGLTGNQQLPVDLSSIGRLKATCPIFEDGHGDHGY